MQDHMETSGKKFFFIKASKVHLISVSDNDKLDSSESLVAVEFESIRLDFSDTRGTLE